MSALLTREEIAEILYDAHEVAWRGVVQRHIPWKDVSGQQRGSYFVMADALLARLRPAWATRDADFAELSRLWENARRREDEAVDSARQMEAERDALRTSLAQRTEELKLAKKLWEDDNKQHDASLALKDEALRACVEALERRRVNLAANLASEWERLTTHQVRSEVQREHDAICAALARVQEEAGTK